MLIPAEIQTALTFSLNIFIRAKIQGDARIPGDRKRDMQIKSLIGQSIITRYNNKTYRIDDIDFAMNPMSTFDRNGTPITYVQYYK